MLQLLTHSLYSTTVPGVTRSSVLFRPSTARQSRHFSYQVLHRSAPTHLRARTHHVGGLCGGGIFYPTVSLLLWRGDNRDSHDGSGGSVDTGTKMEDIVLTVMGKEDRLTNALRV